MWRTTRDFQLQNFASTRLTNRLSSTGNNATSSKRLACEAFSLRCVVLDCFASQLDAYRCFTRCFSELHSHSRYVVHPSRQILVSSFRTTSFYDSIYLHSIEFGEFCLLCLQCFVDPNSSMAVLKAHKTLWNLPATTLAVVCYSIMNSFHLTIAHPARRSCSKFWHICFLLHWTDCYDRNNMLAYCNLNITVP